MGIGLVNISSSNVKQWGAMTYVFAVIFLLGAGS